MTITEPSATAGAAVSGAIGRAPTADQRTGEHELDGAKGVARSTEKMTPSMRVRIGRIACRLGIHDWNADYGPGPEGKAIELCVRCREDRPYPWSTNNAAGVDLTLLAQRTLLRFRI
jgi:hypothetical protein